VEIYVARLEYFNRLIFRRVASAILNDRWAAAGRTATVTIGATWSAARIERDEKGIVYSVGGDGRRGGSTRCNEAKKRTRSA
jgi:hypothetical protein